MLRYKSSRTHTHTHTQFTLYAEYNKTLKEEIKKDVIKEISHVYKFKGSVL